MPLQRKSAHQFAFEHYLRTGERLPAEQWLRREEHKFNPYHDEIGRFTSPPGVTVSYGDRTGGRNGRTASAYSRRAGSSTHDPLPDMNTGNRHASVRDARPRKARNTIVTLASVLPPRSLRTRAHELDSGYNELVRMPNLDVVLFGPGVSLVPVPVATFQEFDSAAALASRASRLDAVITGPQFDLSGGSEGLHGQALIGGRVYGNSAPGLYYVGTITESDGTKRLKFGKGDLRGSGVDEGFGGGIPLLVAGRDVTGYDAAWNSYSETIGKGKNILAYNSASNISAVFVQPDGKEGYALQSVRQYIRNSGYDYALLFDGSDSVSLTYGGSHYVSPGLRKQLMIPLGIGIRSVQKH